MTIMEAIDWIEPAAAFAPLAHAPHACLFSAGAHCRQGRWSIIAALPSATLDLSVSAPGAPETLRKFLADRPAAAPVELPFCGGVAGYIGYEAAVLFEPGLALPASPYGLPDISLGAYDAVAVFDHCTRRSFVIGENARAVTSLRDRLGREAAPRAAPPAPASVKASHDLARYSALVEAAREDILNGAYYQANLSQAFTCDYEADVDALAIYLKIASESDVPFAAFVRTAEGAVISNSPERFFRIAPHGANRKITAEPIKGTARRGASTAEDSAILEALRNDPKERAENIMIADLLRNDLSRLCVDHSIREEAICEVLSFSSVHHLVSRISGMLNADAGAFDVLQALFPCGSITGAPKIAAMRAIARFEGRGRGPYCGAIGYFSDCGAADFSVAIRALIAEGRRVSAPVGGGVTLRSDGRREYEETLVKAASAMRALGAGSGFADVPADR